MRPRRVAVAMAVQPWSLVRVAPDRGRVRRTTARASPDCAPVHAGRRSVTVSGTARGSAAVRGSPRSSSPKVRGESPCGASRHVPRPARQRLHGSWWPETVTSTLLNCVCCNQHCVICSLLLALSRNPRQVGCGNPPNGKEGCTAVHEWETSRALCLGEAMGVLHPDQPGGLTTSSLLRCSVGGAEANVAGALAALGVETTWLSRLGNDPLGELVASDLTRRGVTVLAERDEERPTGLYLKEITDTGSRMHYYRNGSA